MTAPWIFAAGAAVGAFAMAAPRLVTHVRATHAASRSRGAPAHTVARFEFTVRAPMGQVAPLFGADRERAWAPGWNPAFVFPATPSDVRGMVFQVAHGGMNAVWVNTDFDPEAGRVQYAYVIPDALVTLITIRLTPQGDTTHVAVEYQRTALRDEAHADVQRLAERDRRSGPEWEEQINEYLAKRK
jgi:hypothetical protein